ncbi:phage tail protein [Aquimarina longa]|uniref:phage tail protein n=1 Tax=Aquimarina longa TaxID=1080221 RepID=UPI0007855F29|nr:phage tail protein [Aquimarina longa]
MSSIFPHKSYRFKVSFLFGNIEVEGYFQSIDGLKGGYSTNPYAEGGVAAFSHQLTNRSSFGPLTLKRGLTKDRALFTWCEATFQTMTTVPANILISLLDENKQPIDNWLIVHAIPFNWDVSSFDATQSKIAFETIKLNYQYFTRI